MGEIRVLEILPGHRAVISTRGLRRVVIKNTDKILAELLEPHEAKLFANTYNSSSNRDSANVVPYTTPRESISKPLRKVQ